MSNNFSTLYSKKTNILNIKKPFNNKNINECIFEIPANIFQTWESKKIPTLMFQSILSIIKNNPNFRYYLFDDQDCLKFIKENFNKDILEAYDNLIPGAYKADLWRYCILYKMGGIYIDIKYRPINGFRLYNLLEKEHWVLDIDGKKIYNAIIVCKPGNQILLNAINKIVENVKNKYYGNSSLEPTGPALLEKFFLKEEKNNFDMKHIIYGNNDYEKVVQFNYNIVFSCYPGYFEERKYSSKKHYSDSWRERNIYL
jgi:mannosyltransferase OCH1-like enzyme